MKVSFDFDHTLTLPSVKKFAKELVDDGIDVWICTSRRQLGVPEGWNDEVFLTAQEIGIKLSNIIFTESRNKAPFVTDMVFHLDDDFTELNLIGQRGVSVRGAWEHKCRVRINYGCKVEEINSWFDEHFAELTK